MLSVHTQWLAIIHRLTNYTPSKYKTDLDVRIKHCKASANASAGRFEMR